MHFRWREHVVDVAVEYIELLFPDIKEKILNLDEVPSDLSGFPLATDLDAYVRVTMLTTNEAKEVLEELEGDAPSEENYTGPWRAQWNNRAMDTLVEATRRVVDDTLVQMASAINLTYSLLEERPAENEVNISTFSDSEGTHIEINIYVEVDGKPVEDAGYDRITVEY